MKGVTVLLPVISKFLDKFLDALVPRRCVGCGQRVTVGLHPNIGDINKFVCARCLPEKQEPTPFISDGYFSYPYEGIFRQLLYDLKFNHRRDVIPTLRSLVPLEFFSKYDLVIPVPSHWLRRLQHGGDHVRALLKELKQLNANIVFRHRYTPAFYSLGKDQRAKIIRGAFHMKQPLLVKGMRILVVDDIYTTGATFRELKRVLLESGAVSVDGYFLTKV